MMLHQRRVFFYFRIIITLTVLALLFGIITLRVDLQPNRISVNADPPGQYTSALIHPDFGGGAFGQPINAGQTLPGALTQYGSFKIEFTKQPIWFGHKFLLTDYQFTEGVETTTWQTAFPARAMLSENVKALVLTSLCDEADFSLEIGSENWPVELHNQNQGTLIARRPLDGVLSDSNIRVDITKPIAQEPGDLRNLPSCLGSLTIIEGDQPIRIAQVKLDKTFGRVGVRLPYVTWGADEIIDRFVPSEPNMAMWVEDGWLMLEPGDNLQAGLIYQGNLGALSDELGTQVSRYTGLLYMLAVVSAGFLYLGLGWMASLLTKYNNHIVNKCDQRKAEIKVLLNNFLKNQPIRVENPDRVLAFIFLIAFLAYSVQAELQKPFGVPMLLGFLLLVVLGTLINQRISGGRLASIVKRTHEWLEERDSILVVALMGVATFTLFYRLGAHDFYEDEFQVIGAATGYLRTGSFYLWEWIHQQISNIPYERAWPHTMLIAQSFRIFGISEWSARVVSVLFGLVFLLSLYLIARFFTNRQIAVMSLAASVLYMTFLNIFRYTRMYALLVPLFLILVYCVYRGLTGEWWIKTTVPRVDSFIEQHLNFDYRFLLLSLPLLYLNYHIHFNSLVIVLAAYVFICILALIERKKKYIYLAILGLLGLFGLYAINALNLLNQLPWVIGLVSTFNVRNTDYLYYLFRYPFSTLAGVILFVFVGIVLIRQRKSEHFSKMLYLYIITVTATVFFIYVADRYVSFLYISHIMPIAIILIIGGFWYLTHSLPKLAPSLKLYFWIIVVFHFLTNAPAFYNWEGKYGQHSEAYQVIIDHYQYEDEVIFGQYLRTYYLQPLHNIRHISMRNLKQYTFDHFIADLEKYDSGWVTWETRKSYHLDDQVRAYIDTYFLKLHGEGVDETGVEVYYYSTTDQ